MIILLINYNINYPNIKLENIYKYYKILKYNSWWKNGE
jgi:hypothetical protein